MRHVCGTLLLLCLVFGPFGSGAYAQTAAQAYALQKYNEFNAARETTWRARAQGQPDHVVQQYLAYERSAWDAYTQAQHAANQQVNQMWVNHYAQQVDNAIAGWTNLVRTLYDRRDVNSYNVDADYRFRFDQWVRAWTNYANNMISQLWAYRQQLVGTPNPPAPPAYDPRYTSSDDGPTAVSHDFSRGAAPGQ